VFFFRNLRLLFHVWAEHKTMCFRKGRDCTRQPITV